VNCFFSKSVQAMLRSIAHPSKWGGAYKIQKPILLKQNGASSLGREESNSPMLLMMLFP